MKDHIERLLQERFGDSIGSYAGDAPAGAEMKSRNEIDEVEIDETNERGPSKKTAKKILRGTKTFKGKVKKVAGWADDPEVAAAWMMHKASGKWPSES
jgi:hypothetical protein